MSRYTYSFLFLLLSTLAFGQKLDSLFKDRRLLNGIRVGADVAGIVYGVIVKSESFKASRYEINGDLGIKRWFIASEIGWGQFQRKEEENFSYTSSGTYVRLGADYRISKSAKSFLFFGGRICTAWYNENGHFYVPGLQALNGTKLRDEYDKSFNRENSRANWVEVATGVKAHLWNNFYMGYTIRFKLCIYVQQSNEFETLDIPGFGIANRDRDSNINTGSNMGFSFNLMYRIPFGKDPVIPLKLR